MYLMKHALAVGRLSAVENNGTDEFIYYAEVLDYTYLILVSLNIYKRRTQGETKSNAMLTFVSAYSQFNHVLIKANST